MAALTDPTDLSTVPCADVLAEDRLLWQFWVNKGMEAGPLSECLARLGPDSAWDYVAGNALYGGFEEALLGVLERAPSAGAGRPPDEFLQRLRRDVAGSRHAVVPGGPEARLLVLCASPRMTAPEDEDVAALARGPLDWEALAAASARANVTAALHHNLARLGLLAHVPAGQAGVLARRAAGIAARNARLLGLLDEVAGLLAEERIRLVLMKESGLALSHFGNGRLRMMGDIDLLLEEARIEQVVRRLEAAGWQSAEVLWTKQRYRKMHHHAAPLVHPDRAAKIEPHRSFAVPPLPGLDGPPVAPPGLVARMMARAVRIDAKCWCLIPADTLLHLGLDLWGSAFIGKAGQACDARELVRQGGVDWPLLEESARELGAGAHMAFSLRLISELDTPVPPEVIGRLEGAGRAPFDGRRLEAMARRNLFGYVPALARHSRAAERLLFLALTRPGGWAGRAAFLLKRYLYLGESEEDSGHLRRRALPGTGRAVGRMLTLPWRALHRWTSSRRMP